MVVITTIVVLLPHITKSKKVEVPDVTNMTETEAVKKLKSEGFEITETIETYSNDIEEGSVIKTNPAAGTTRKKGSDVKVYVSLGTQEINIEDYTGQDYSFVQGKLEALGLTVFIEYEETTSDSSIEPDQIIRQSVAAETKLTSGDSIILYVLNANVYPDFTTGDYTVSDILSFAEENEITANFKDSDGNKLSITSQNVDEYSDANVVKQSRNAGSNLTKGATITFTLDIGSDEESESDLD